MKKLRHTSALAKRVRIDGDIVWLSDGKREYPLKKYKLAFLNKTFNDVTEPL